MKIIKSSIPAISLALLSGCGVRGNPQPPLEPVAIGRGEPTFNRATEGLKIELKNPKKKQDDSNTQGVE